MAERGQQASHPIPPLPPPSRAKIRTPFRLLKEQDDERYERYDDERDMLILEEDLDTVMKSLPHHTAARLRYEEGGGGRDCGVTGDSGYGGRGRANTADPHTGQCQAGRLATGLFYHWMGSQHRSQRLATFFPIPTLVHTHMVRSGMEVTANSTATTRAAVDADSIGMQVHISSAMQVGGGRLDGWRGG